MRETAGGCARRGRRPRSSSSARACAAVAATAVDRPALGDRVADASGAGRARCRDPGTRSAPAGAPPAAPCRSRPENEPPGSVMSPRSGSISRMTHCARVDLPEPDSPTRPSVSPRRMLDIDPVDRLDHAACRRRARERRKVLAMPAETATGACRQAARAAAPASAPRRAGRACRLLRAAAALGRAALPRPAGRVCITATRSAISATTPKSWVMNRMPVPRRRAGPASAQDLRLGGDVERGGRLVGDQQAGSSASAVAIITRWHWPPDSWCG